MPRESVLCHRVRSIFTRVLMARWLLSKHLQSCQPHHSGLPLPARRRQHCLWRPWRRWHLSLLSSWCATTAACSILSHTPAQRWGVLRKQLAHSYHAPHSSAAQIDSLSYRAPHRTSGRKTFRIYAEHHFSGLVSPWDLMKFLAFLRPTHCFQWLTQVQEENIWISRFMNLRPDKFIGSKSWWWWKEEKRQTKAEAFKWIRQFDEKLVEAPIKRDFLVPITGFYRHC